MPGRSRAILSAAAALCGMTALLPWLPLPLVGLAAGLFVYARRYLQSCRGEWGNGRLRLCRGVWFRREWVIAQSAVRELDVFAPPLHRLLSCRTFCLRYAGGSVWIPPIDNEQAQRLLALWEELS